MEWLTKLKVAEVSAEVRSAA